MHNCTRVISFPSHANDLTLRAEWIRAQKVGLDWCAGMTRDDSDRACSQSTSQFAHEKHITQLAVVVRRKAHEAVLLGAVVEVQVLKRWH